jgi:hypothetical protein
VVSGASTTACNQGKEALRVERCRGSKSNPVFKRFDVGVIRPSHFALLFSSLMGRLIELLRQLYVLYSQESYSGCIIF